MSFNEVMGLVMLLCMVTVIFVGFSIAFTLLFTALAFGALTLGPDRTFYLTYLQIWSSMKDDVLPAIPLFIFMGYMAEKADLMSRLFQTLRLLLAPLRGSLYLAVLLTATVFAMATGVVGAAVTVLGIMAGPMMVRAGYDPRLSAGAIAAGGTLGILVPPSVMLIVMGPVIGVPVNKLYSAAVGPGLMLALVYIVYCLVRSNLNPALGPAVPKEERAPHLGPVLRDAFFSVVPLVGLIAATLGSILAGLATATEAAACGAFGATLLALAHRKLSWASLIETCRSTTLTSSMVLFLVMASNVFGAVFVQTGASAVLAGLIDTIPLPDMGKLLLIMAVIFLLGWPFEWPAIVLVFMPIFLPIVEQLELGLPQADMMLWFGAIVAVNLQTAFLSPPVAMSAYYLRNVMPQWSLSMIFSGMAQFMMLQVVVLLAILCFPQIALWIPQMLHP